MLHSRLSPRRQMLALALALGCVACTDRNPVLPDATPEAELLGMLQCTADVRTLRMTCTEATPPSGGISPALFGTNQIKLASANVAHDSETSIFGMDVTAQNLLSYAIGTPDGITRAGIKVYFEKGPTANYYTPGDTGTVRVHNPSGYQNITAAQQPYFLYDTILQPQEVAAPQRWEFYVPATVRSFGFTVRIFTATQQENKVPSRAPNHMPAAYENPSNWNRCFGNSPIRCVTNAVRLGYHDWASAEERQSAVDFVKGRVDGGDGVFYYVTVPTNGSVDSLWSTIRNLEKLPQVRQATPVITESGLTVSYSLPHDNPQWRQWKLNPDDADGQNWALERIDAPYAWGCSVGDTTTAVAVLDVGFHALSDISKNLNTTLSAGVGAYAADTVDHGTRVAAVMAARGNDTSQVTGTMWRANLRAYDISVDSAGKALGAIDFRRTFTHLQEAGKAGARVINLSFGLAWRDSTNKHFRNPATEGDPLQRSADSASMAMYAGALEAALDAIVAAARDPLIVIAAGNDGLDARWQGMAGALTGTHGHRIILVAASTSNNSLWTDSNRGTAAQIAAPGAGLHVLWGNGSIDSTRTLPSGSMRAGTGTSFAAPHVAGAAGLLFSFDPRLTAGQVKNFLTRGARIGNRLAGGIPILNIRESLVLAGQTTGAPLCGNRLWTEGGTNALIAQRGTGTEAIVPSVQSKPDFTGHHFGRTLWHPATSYMWRHSVSGWKRTPWTATDTALIVSGVYNSTVGRSHGSDTLIVMNYIYHTDGPMKEIAVRLRHGTSESHLTTVTLPAYSTWSGDECVRYLTDGFGNWKCHETIPVGTFDSVVPKAFYSPRGDFAYIAVSVTSVTRFVSETYTCINDSICKTIGSNNVTKGMTMYRVTLSDGTVSALWTLPDLDLYWGALSEDGRELGAAVTYQRLGEGVPNVGTCDVRFFDAETGVVTHKGPSCDVNTPGRAGFAP